MKWDITSTEIAFNTSLCQDYSEHLFVDMLIEGIICMYAKFAMWKVISQLLNFEGKCFTAKKSNDFLCFIGAILFSRKPLWY